MKKLNTFTKILITALYLFLFFIGYKVYNLTIKTQKSDSCYVITRSTVYPFKVTKISNEYKPIAFNQFVPKKGYTNIGTEYLCNIDMTDSTFLMYFTNKYVGKFHYESLKFYVWELIKINEDSTFKYVDINKNEISVLSDTIFYKGLKIYNIEKYSIDKRIEKDSIISETEKYDQFFTKKYNY